MLPADARPCVWMTAGIVAYKICDHDFECERCPLDAGLCGRQSRRSLRETEPGIRAESFAFPADRSYHRSHTWARPFEQRRVRSGIDAFAAHLLSRAASVILPADGAVIEHGTVGFWIAEDTAPVPLVSPVSGRVLKRNHRVQESPGLVAASPYGEGWLVEVDCPDWDCQRARLVDADRQQSLVQQQLTRFRKRIARCFDRRDPEVGATLADGGEPLRDARRILGPTRYRRLILQFLR